METLERELKEYNKETEKFSPAVSATFNALAHKHIVKTFTDSDVDDVQSFRQAGHHHRTL